MNAIETIDKMLAGTEEQLLTTENHASLLRLQGAIIALKQLKQTLTGQQDSETPN